MIGNTIKHYKILERIGAGGMGVVYRAEDTRLGRIVAMKFLPPYALDSAEDRIRFVNEAQSAAALDHPNICTIHEIGESGEHQFIVMSFVDGPSLKERLKEGPMSPAEAVGIAGQIATGLSKAHEKGIIHRDIKPANILLSTDGLVKICDFGLAKSSISKKVTRTGSTIGTAAYMSPEQARSETVDQRTDVWSLGVILYEMLAGKPPFVADHEAVVIYSILNDECPPLEEKCPGLPAPLYRIVSRALAGKAADRYSSMEEMRKDLKAIAQQFKGFETTSGTFKAIPTQPADDVTRIEIPVQREPAPSGEKEEKRKSSAVLYSVIGTFTLAAVLLLWWFNRIPSIDVPDDEGSVSGSAPAIAPPEAAGDAELAARFAPGSQEKLPVVAVLYMENLGGDHGEDYFAAGLTEDLIYSLSKIKKIRVRSRFDVRPLRGQTLSVNDMGKKLSADYLLEGAVRKEKKQLRLTAHLHRVADNSLLWSVRYDRPTEDVFAVQAEIADSVARAMAVTIEPAERQELTAVPTTNPEAYDHYLRGRHAFERRSQEDNEQAEKSFRRAITLDKDFAAAYTGLARTLLQRGDWGWDDDLKLVDEAEDLLQNAARRDSTSGEYFAARGAVLAQRNERAGAIRLARRALQAMPEDPDAHYGLGVELGWTAQYDEATRELRRTIDLKPDHAHAYLWLARVAKWTGKPTDAAKQYRKALELEPDAVGVLIDYGAFRIQRGEFAAADSLLHRAIALRPKTYDLKAVAGRSALYQGRLTEAVDLLSEANSKAPDWSHLRYLGQAHQLAGKKSQAEKSWRESLKLLGARLQQFSDDPPLLYAQLYLQCLVGDVRDAEPRLKELAKNTKKTPDPTSRYYYMAAIDAHLGNTDRAIENIERVMKMNVLAPSHLAADPAFVNLKNDTRFQKLVGTAPSS